MGVTFNASADNLTDVFTPPARDAFAVSCWVYLNSIRASAWQCIIGLENNGGTGWCFLGFNNAGQFVISIGPAGGSTAFSSAPTAGQWFQCGMSNNGSGIGGFRGYWRTGADSGTHVQASRSGSPSFTAQQLWIGNDQSNEWIDGTIANVKVWGKAWTSADQAVKIQNEKWLWNPADYGQLHAWYPLLNLTDCEHDHGPVNRPLTAGGTLDDGPNPPISWMSHPEAYENPAAAPPAPDLSWFRRPVVPTFPRYTRAVPYRRNAR